MNIGQITASILTPSQAQAVAPWPSAPATPANGATADSQNTQASASTSAQQEVSQQTLQKSVDAINNYLNTFANNSIEFSIDSTTGRLVVEVVDTQTQAVLMQTPSKQTLAIAAALDRAQGLLVQTKA